VVSAEALVTVVVAALPPPVVPPFWVAQPTRSVIAASVLGGAAAASVSAAEAAPVRVMPAATRARAVAPAEVPSTSWRTFLRMVFSLAFREVPRVDRGDGGTDGVPSGRHQRALGAHAGDSRCSICYRLLRPLCPKQALTYSRTTQMDVNVKA
jgi:hypothetical protein